MRNQLQLSLLLCASSALLAGQGYSTGLPLSVSDATNVSFQSFPDDLQFYARDVATIGLGQNGRGYALVDIEGKVSGAKAGSRVDVHLSVDGALLTTASYTVARSGATEAFVLTLQLDAGISQYDVTSDFFEVSSGTTTPHQRAAYDIAVGDSFIVMGQSNALARTVVGSNFVDVTCGSGFLRPPSTTTLVRSFGLRNANRDPNACSPDPLFQSALTDTGWYVAQDHNQNLGGFVGNWALEVAYRVVEREQIAVCMVNGARGSTFLEKQPQNTLPACGGLSGTRPWDTLLQSHIPDPAGHGNLDTLYGQLLRRMNLSGLADKARGMFWHQGENERGLVLNGVPLNTIEYGDGKYKDRFGDLLQDWNMDYPNLEAVFVFQVRVQPYYEADGGITPNRHDMGPLFEDQRTMNTLDDRIVSIPTAGIAMANDAFVHFPCDSQFLIAHRAFAALSNTLPDYVPFLSFQPATPVEIEASVIDIPGQNRGFLKLDFGAAGTYLSLTDTLPATPGAGQPIADRMRLEPAQFEINRVIVDPLRQSVFVEFEDQTGDIGTKPDKVEYLIDRNDGRWLEGRYSMGAFAFTLGVE